MLSPDFEAQLLETNGNYDELSRMRITLIRIQLRVVLRKKVIIEVECPDNPNFKRIIEIYNKKLEALLNLLEEQNKMDQANQFVQVNATNNAQYRIDGGNGGGAAGAVGAVAAAVAADGDGNAAFGNTEFENTAQFGATTEQIVSSLTFSIKLTHAKLENLNLHQTQLQRIIAISTELLQQWQQDPKWQEIVSDIKIESEKKQIEYFQQKLDICTLDIDYFNSLLLIKQNQIQFFESQSTQSSRRNSIDAHDQNDVMQDLNKINVFRNW